MKITSISIVVPIYNEENTIARVILLAEVVAKKYTRDYEIIVVNDGSTDRTLEILETLQKEYSFIKIYSHAKNRGIGEALRTAYTYVTKDFIFLNSADEQVLMTELEKFIPYALDYQIVIGNRKNRKDGVIRIGVAWIYRYLLSLLFGTDIAWDINSMKLYQKKVFSELVLESKSAFIEAEIILKGMEKGYRIKTVDIEHASRSFGNGSGNKWRAVSRQLKDLFLYTLKKI